MTFRMSPGAPFPRRFPGGTWNRFADLLDRLERSDPYDDAARNEIIHQVLEASASVSGSYLRVLVENTSGQDLVELSPVAVAEPGFEYPAGTPSVADAALLAGQVLRVRIPQDSDSVILVATQPIADGGTGEAALLGAVPARVDLQSDSDKTCGPIAGDATKLRGGGGSITILWKPAPIEPDENGEGGDDGLGERWCLVLLGSTAPPEQFRGTITADAEGQPTADRQWLTASPAAGYGTENIRFANRQPGSSSDNRAGQEVSAVRFHDAQSLQNAGGEAVGVAWEERVGGGGASQPLYRCELAADLNYGTATATVWLLSPDGSRQNDGESPPALIPSTVSVNGQLSGNGPDDAAAVNPVETESSVRGTFGYCRLVTDPATQATSLELVELGGVYPSQQVQAGHEESPDAPIEFAFPVGDYFGDPTASRVGGDITTVDMTQIAEYPLAGRVWWDVQRREWYRLTGATLSPKLGYTNVTFDAATNAQMFEGEVEVFRLMSDGRYEPHDPPQFEDWFHLAEGEGIPSGTKVMARPMLTNEGSFIWVIDWEECP